MAILEFRNVCCELGGRSILRGISLTVEQGETVVLLGRSGSGKTTLLKTANRLIAPTAGQVLFEGKPAEAWDLVRLRRRMGYAIQDVGLFPHLTVRANVGLVPKLEGQPAEETRRRVDHLLKLVGLAPDEFGERLPRQLSGGQKQRVGVARALAADPPLLLFDEPFASLDPITRYDLQQLFLNLRRTVKKTALFVTHDIREALMIASRIVLLRGGQVELVAAPSQFFAQQSAEARAFLATLDTGTEEQ